MGGGVTGDLVGLAAATWLRGVPFVQVPTSLAAMVDASIGGKVAVNLPVGKNLVGAFYQPKLVLQDVDHLQTLPAREMAAGWAEAIKHGLILDADLLDTFEKHADEMQSLEGELAVRTIRRSVQIKAEVVSADEFERGDTRVLLNYGHTVGHAIEAVTGYGKYLHGEAVSIGMMAAAGIAQRLGMIGQELVDRQRAVLRRYNLPVTVSGATAEQIIAATRSDKKSRGGSIRWVLLEGPGKAVTRRDVPEDVVREAVEGVIAG
jgi:3-dehydroquinate synthase